MPTKQRCTPHNWIRTKINITWCADGPASTWGWWLWNRRQRWAHDSSRMLGREPGKLQIQGKLRQGYSAMGRGWGGRAFSTAWLGPVPVVPWDDYSPPRPGLLQCIHSLLLWEQLSSGLCTYSPGLHILAEGSQLNLELTLFHWEWVGTLAVWADPWTLRYSWSQMCLHGEAWCGTGG